MVILTALHSGDQLERVRAAIRDEHRLVPVCSVRETRALLHEIPVDALVIDPLLDEARVRTVPASEIMNIGIEFPYLPIVFYVTRPADAIKLIARFPSHGRCDAVVMDIDDEAEVLGETINSVVGCSWAGTVLRALGLETSVIPSALNDAVRLVFSQPHFFRTADELAIQACMSRRTLDRWLSRCGLVPAGELLQIAKALLAIRLERDMIVGRDRLHATCQISRETTFDAFMARTLGSRYQQLRAAFDGDVAALVDRYVRRPSVAFPTQPQ